MTENRLMKDGLNSVAIQRIAASLSKVHKPFAANDFRQQVCKELDTLELKERVNHVIAHLYTFLPQPFSKTYRVLKQLPNVWDFGEQDDPLRGFAAWPVIDYIGEHGLEDEDLSLDLLARLTHLFSAEFAVRPFYQQNPEKTFAVAQQWAESKNYHLRRLASEGCRPRLPWGIRLKKLVADPAPIFPLLEKLKNDESEYVRKSVANNLNDISKDHPDQVIKLCKRWQKNNHPNTQWIVKHALRTLIKAGDNRVFPLLGFEASPQISLAKCTIKKRNIRVGDTLEFDLSLTAENKKQKLVVDYAIHFMKANGTTSAKVFKLREITLGAGEQITISKQHSFKPITTRKYYPGKHALSVLVNGVMLGGAEFTLL
ncbi:DNA alkylation repair protein [Teredinibacter sp. KSP-S5-2]|uniref:DNA alkylation repair protein n=1 Tax=Teredinibacter sp. KSP-S5-2 TaxID=3034506 RepID=UPI0029342F7B|nr:DNA alkylation repair protein [Teredinibacter sp. KSP-S5-2]WNO08694.1 DNA alkylation repair protein [Teredinibacter sp. KSP-S5-2]